MRQSGIGGQPIGRIAGQHKEVKLTLEEFLVQGM